MSRFDSTTFMSGLLVGAAAGAVAGLLYAPRRGAALDAIERRLSSGARDRQAGEPQIDEAIDQSFPASDPPSWTAATTNPTLDRG